jgi:small-conductance mechanosensitive channel
MTQLTIQQVNEAIMFGNFSNDQLNGIAMSIKYARTQKAKQVKSGLKVGDTVKFPNSRTGYDTVGTVTKIAIKYITIRESGRSVGGLWRVPASMISLAE